MAPAADFAGVWDSGPTHGANAAPIRLTNNPEIDDWPDWSPDGAKIVFDSDHGGNRDLYVIGLMGPTRRRSRAIPVRI